MLLDDGFVGLSGSCKASAQGMAGVKREAFLLGHVGTKTGGEGRLLDQAGDVLVIQAGIERFCTVAAGTGEDRSPVLAGEMQPLFECVDRASRPATTAPDGNLTPAGFPLNSDDSARVQDFDPSAPVLCVAAVHVERHQF